MKYIEELHWILDKNVKSRKQIDDYQQNIDFVHSLGLKCDSVGWSTLDLSNPKANEILESISSFCQKNNCKSRCFYIRKYTDITSDWYEIEPTFFKNDTLVNKIDTLSEMGKPIQTSVIRAFHESTAALKRRGMDLYAPERFRNACIRHNFAIDFCWAKDKGKYEAEQYFHVYGKQLIPRIAVDWDLEKAGVEKLRQTNGWLPKIADIIDEIQIISLPDCYLATDMPESGIAYAYIPQTFSCCGSNALLVHKKVAEILLQEKAVSPSALRPVPIVDSAESICNEYVLRETCPLPRPTPSYIAELHSEYENLQNTPRPIRMVSEKEALKTMRATKKERKEDFRKCLPKSISLELYETEYNALIPYYLISNGGFLSDEYELLSYEQSVAETSDFYKHVACEELIIQKPDGLVIAKCPDGDAVLLCKNGLVIRYSHEAPEAINQWPSLAQFIVDAITEI